MPGRKFAPDLDLPIALDRAAQTPLHQQLCEQLRQAILKSADPYLAHRVSGGSSPAL